MGPSEAVDLLSRLSGRPYLLVGRLRGGETGAHAVRDSASGDTFVVKWEEDEPSKGLRREAVAFTGRLRDAAGWPVPGQRTVEGEGTLFVLQDLLPGQPIDEVTHGLVDQILDLHERRVGLARAEDPSHWPEALIETLVVGGRGYCRHDSLRSFDRRTADLVAAVEEFGRSVDPGDLTGGDYVHWDLHPGNLLGDGGGLSGVVDNDFVVVGDAAFDLVMLALTSVTVPCEPGVRTRLRRAAFEGLSDVRAQAYLGHLLVRVIDWPIRRGDRAAVEFWLEQADRLPEQTGIQAIGAG